MGLSRRMFTKEFKLAAVQRLDRGSSISEVARALEVNPNVLHRWRDAGLGATPLAEHIVSIPVVG
jgi:transposase-like protein